MVCNTRGFTLIEALLSVAIIGLIAGTSIPLYQSFQVRTDLETTTESIATMIRRAQIYARGQHQDSMWGVKVQAGSATLFKGSTFTSRDTAYDEVTTIPETFSATGLSDLSFSKLSGMPNATGTISLTSSNNETRIITVNGEGMVAY